MRRTRIALPLALAAAALTVTGVAAATRHAQSTQAAAADFTASTVSRIHTDTCAANDGTYQVTSAAYRGSASSADARLNGELEIRASSVVNTTTKLGWLEGTFRTRSASGTIHAAIANGAAAGSVTGRASGDARLVASFSAAFSPATGFSSGKLGSGSANGAGILFTRGECRKARRLPSTAVFRLGLHGSNGEASGNLTLDLTRDATGTVTGGSVVFYVNYRFRGAATINGLTLRQQSNGAVALDSGVTSFTDADGRGNVTKVVTSASATLLNALLSNPRDYYVELATTGGALRDRLRSPERR